LLVLQGTQDDPVPRASPLRERQAMCRTRRGVGRVVEDGTDEEQVRAERMDQWIAWEAEERVKARGEG